MRPVKLIPYYTYEDYCHWEGRWELIDGIPFAMTPSIPLNQWIEANVLAELNGALKQSNSKECKVYAYIDLKIKEDTILQPDGSIICGETPKNFLDFPPTLVVGTLSESTALKDRITKFSIYEKFGIKYYLIVEPKKETVEIYSLKDSKYVLQTFSPENPFTFSLSDDCDINVVVKNFWE